MDGVSHGVGSHGPVRDRTGSRPGRLRSGLLLALLSLLLAGVGVHTAAAQVAGTTPEVDVSAHADPPVATEGDTVTFTVLVENTGDVPLDDVTIALGDGAEHGHDGALRPGELVEHTVTVEIAEEDVRLGSVVATFVAEATDDAGTVVRSATAVTVEVLGHPRHRGAVWADAPADDGGSVGSRGGGAGASIAVVVLLTVLAALLGGWLVGRVGGARS